MITRLNKISLNPFGEWSYSRNRNSGIDLLPDSIREGNDTFAQLSANIRYGNKMPVAAGNVSKSQNQPTQTATNGTGTLGNKRKAADPAQLLKEQKEEFTRLITTEPKTLLLHSYYYAESTPEHLIPPPGLFPPSMRCPLCSKQFLNNLEVVRHILLHVQSLGIRNQRGDSICDYCLKDVGSTVKNIFKKR